MSEERTRLYCSRCLTSFQDDLEQCSNLSCRRDRPTGGWGQILAPGDTFDRTYKIHRLLAMGGGGITYLGRELNDDAEEEGVRLAIKVLFAHRTQGSYLRRLATEAQILQELNHPHIVEYRGFVHRTGHAPYLVTRFEPGGSLLDHVRRVGTLPVRRAAAIGTQICSALEKGHEFGVIHRDLKPENVLLSEVVTADQDPLVRVVDFGIAKVDSSLNSGLTRAGAFVGTPHFAAPEQFMGARVEPAADIYAVGAMLHFCMMGRHVIQFADRLAPEDTYDLLLETLPPQINRPTDPPADVERMNRVLAVVMAPMVQQRCTALQLRRMLEAILQDADPPLPDRPPSGADTLPPMPSPPDAGRIPTIPATPEPSTTPTTDSGATPSTPPPLPPGREEKPRQEPELEPKPDRGRGRGCLLGLPVLGGIGAAALLAVVLLGLALRGGWGERLEPIDPALPVLAGTEVDAESREDYRRIYASLENLRDHLQQTCEIQAGTLIRLEVALAPASAEGTSGIERARVRSGEDAPCVRQQLERARVSRAASRAVRMPKDLQW